jgi:outer membrane protein TolC
MKTTYRATARFVACLLASLVLFVPYLAAAQQTVTLEEAVQLALGRSPQMLQQEQALENAALAERSAWGAFLPSVSASSSGSLRSANILDPNTGRIIGGSSDSYSAGVSGRVDLFRGGSRFVELDRTEADMQVALARRESQRFAVALTTKNLFFASLRQSDLLEVSRRRVEQADQNLQIVRARSQLGRATISDSLRARLDLVNARQAVLQGETALRAARFALGRQVGESAPVVSARPDDLDPSELPLTEAEIMEFAEASAPTVVAAAYLTSAAAASVRAARTGYLPTLSMSTGYNWNNQDRSFTGGSTSWSLGLSVSYPIFNNFQRESTLDRAQFSQRIARLQEDDTRLAARQEADAALYNLRTAQRAIEIAEEASLVAGEDLRVVRERYSVGVATILDILISQSAADQASVDVVTSRYDYVLARAELESILGREL